MDLSYYPTIHEKAGYQFSAEKESSLKTYHNTAALSRKWDGGDFKIVRQELIQGNVTLVVSMFDVTEPMLITRRALPVNDLYIFDFTLTEQEHMRTFGQETIHCKMNLDCCGFSAGTVPTSQMHDPGHLFHRVEILISRSYLMHFVNELSPDEKPTLYDHIENNDDFFRILPLSLSEAKLVHNLINMYLGKEQSKKMIQILSTNLVHEILAKLLHRLHSKDETNNVTVHRSDFNKIIEVKKMMESQLDMKYRMHEICNYCSMSVSKFKYLFKSVVGYSFSHYYTKIRMEEAARQLEGKSAESISQLSLQLGYKNLSQFTRTFKVYFNYSPTDFLKGNGRDSWT